MVEASIADYRERFLARGLSAVADTTFFWDFFGPRAEGTARHFLRHLDEFLERERIAGCGTAVEQPGAAQWTVSCRTPAEAASRVRLAPAPAPRARGGRMTPGMHQA